MDEPSKSSGKSKSTSSSSSSKLKKDEKRSNGDTFSSDFLRQKLKEYFKHSDFKSSLQKDAIKEIMRGKRDVYISMPTGSGKSLCYQLPGMLHENKITIVFSPLIALIKDQMDHLTRLKICAESLNSKMTMKERDRVINDLKSIRPTTKFLYITPEQAATEFFRTLLDSIVKYNKLALIAVDECHCVSEMGHQFRRDYLKLGELRKRYPSIKWIALTATASKDVTQDVFKQLALKEPKTFKTPCFRKNLYYDIIFKNSIQDDFIHLKNFILKCLKSKSVDETPNKAPCGIVYCRTRESVERVAFGLTKQNVLAKAYHAGLNDKERKQIQEDWTDGKFPVICATNSFGMGVDKGSVRFVVHWDVPQNIAAYYQESGRAGRDGHQSYCRLYYDRQEVKTISFLLNQQLQKDPDNVKSKRSLKEFDKLVECCESLRCRHFLFANYFGDQAPDCKKKNLCDVCKDIKSAEKKLETFHKLAMNGFTSKMDVDFDDSDLYEGGRNAVHESEAAYAQDNDDYDDGFNSSKRDAKAKKETKNLIDAELQRRRQKIEAAKKLEQTQTRSFGIRVKSSAHTKKIIGLDVKKRESYLDYLLKVLQENAEKATEELAHQLKACDFEDIAAELEYKCFTNNRVLVMYTKAISVERLRIDRFTKNNELLPEIKDHTPKKRTAHGGSSEAMQRDLDEFMQKNNISSETNNAKNHVNGFQTARHIININNKLKEPNRMKKDPLTQMSINSFFPAASIKREPEDNLDDDQDGLENSQQQAKRRKVETEVAPRIKTEPMDTYESVENSSVPTTIKTEPNYDSDAGTEKGSDDETGSHTQPPHPSTKNGTDTRAPITKPTTNNRNLVQDTSNVNNVNGDDNVRSVVKTEQYSDDAETDAASDNEAETVTGTNRVQRYKSKSHRDNAKEIRDQRRNEQSFVQKVHMTPAFNDDDESIAMVVAEPVRINDDNIKNEPEDEDIRSDVETDDESQVNERSTLPRYSSNERQNQISDDLYQQPSTSTSTSGFTYNSCQEPSTSKQYVRPLSPPPLPPIYQEPIEKPLYNVGLRSTKPGANIVDGYSIPRYNQLEPVETETPIDYIEINEDGDIDYDELGDAIADFVDDEERQCDKEIEEIKKVKIEELNMTERIAYLERIKKVYQKKQLIYNKKVREEAKENEKEKEKMRTDYMLELFASTFNIDELENRMLKRRDKPHSHDMEHKVISYSQFMMKQEPNCEHELPKKEHNVIVALNEHIHNMHDANMIDMVPRKAIEDVKKNKKKLRDMVERYLMPHYQARRINKILYEEICKNIVHHHFKSNDYNEINIKNRVNRVVEKVIQAK